MQRFITRTLLVSVLLLGLAAFVGAPVNANDDDDDDFHDHSSAGAVFVGTNHNNTNTNDLDSDEPANRVVMYRRAHDGSLKLVDHFATGGQGSGPGIRFAGDGLGAAHSVQLSQDRRWLFVTNAGSNTVSVFRVKRNGLKLTDVVPTGDGSPSHRFPNSVTQHDDLVYVLNSAGNGSITGFRLTHRGRLNPIPDSTRGLEANQLRFPRRAVQPHADLVHTGRQATRGDDQGWASRSRGRPPQ